MKASHKPKGLTRFYNEVDFCLPVRHASKMSALRPFDLWIQGYRDGWKGGKPALFAPQEWINGWTEGNRDRRHGWAQPRYAHLTDRPPGEDWVERK